MTYFQINDITLTVPPTAISVHKENLEYNYKTLRTRVSTKVASGNGVLHGQIGLVFPPESILELHRLVCQIKNNPFVYINNSYLEESIGRFNEPAYFTVVGLNISNHPSAPNTFIAELDIRYFNEKPYDRNLGFRKNLSLLKIDNDKYELPFNMDSSGTAPEPLIVKLEKPEVITPIGELLNSIRVLNPKESNDYIAYSNYLQIMHLKSNFGITVEEEVTLKAFGLEKKEPLLTHNTGLDIQGLHTLLRSSNIISDMLGIGKASKDGSYKGKSRLENFYENINDQTVVFGVRDFKEFNFPSDLMKALRAEVSKGIKRGMTVEQKEEIRKENAKSIFSILDDASEVFEGKKDKTKPILKTLKTFVKIGDEEDYKELVIENISVENLSEFITRTKEYSTFKSDLLAIQEERKPLVPGKPTEGDLAKLKQRIEIEDAEVKSLIDTWKSGHKSEYDQLTNMYILSYIQKKMPFFSKQRGDYVFLNYDRDSNTQVMGYGVADEDLILNVIEKKQEEVLKTLVLDDPEGKKVIYYDFNFQVTSNQLGFDEVEGNTTRLVEVLVRLEYDYEDTISYANLKQLIKEYKEYVTQYGYQPYSARYGYENILEGMVYHAFPVSNPEIDFRQTTITAISGGFKNLVTSIPILGQSFPTHQYMGGMEPMYQFNFIGKAEGEGLPHDIRLLDENIIKLSLQNAKSFAGIPGASNIYVQSLITRLLGSTKSYSFDISALKDRDKITYMSLPETNFSISSSDSFTIEGNPGAVGYNLRISESKTYDDELIGKVKSNNINPKAYESLAQRIQNSSTYARNLVKAKDLEGSSSSLGKKSEWKFMEWQSKYFSADIWYGKRSNRIKRTLNSNWKTVVTEAMDKNAYHLCVDYLDVIQDLITRAASYYGAALYGFSANPRIHLISTLDIPGGTRKPTSQHHFNAAADFVVKGMPCAFVVQLIELYSHYAFGDGGFKHNRLEQSETGDPKDYGLGIYGRNSFDPEGNTIAEYYKPWLGSLFDLFTGITFDKEKYKNGDGFIHIDLSLNKNDDSFTKKNQYRRWVGETLGDRFCLVDKIDTEKGINDLVKEHYQNFNNYSLGQNDLSVLNSANSVTKKIIQAELTLNTAIKNAGLSLAIKPADPQKLTQWETLHKNYSKEVAKLFFPTYGNYEANGNNKDILYDSEEEYLLKKEIIVNKDTSTGANFNFNSKIIEFIFNFEESNSEVAALTTVETETDEDSEESKESPAGKVEAYNLSKIRDIENFFKNKGSADSYSSITLVPYSDLPDRLKRKFNDYKEIPTARFALIELENDIETSDSTVQAFIKYAKDTFQVDVKSGEDGDEFSPEIALAYPIGDIRGSENYNEIELARLREEYSGLFNGFQTLASLMLTEPSLYTRNLVDAADEYKRITKELYGTLVVPSFYTSVSSLFAAPSILSWSGDELSSRKAKDLGLSIEGELGAGGIGVAALIAGGLTLGPLILVLGGIALAGYGLYNAGEQIAGLSQTEKDFVELYQSRFKEFVDKIIKNERRYKEELDIDEELTQIEFQLAKYLKDLKRNSEEDFSHKELYEMLVSKDTYMAGIDAFIKKIYSQIPVFEDFYKRGVSIKGASSLANLLTQKSVTVTEGNESYESFTVLSNEILVREIIDLIKTFTEYPMIKASVMGEDASWYELTEYLNDIEDFEDLFTVEPGKGIIPIYKERLYDKVPDDYWFSFSPTLPALFELAEKYTDNSISKKLKDNNNKKLAFLKVIYESLLKDIALLEADKIREEDPALAAQIEELDLLDLVDKDLYPDIETPKFSYTQNGYSEKYLPPYYYYSGFADDKKRLDIALSDNEKTVIEKTIKDSEVFMENLRKGIYTGSRPDVALNISPGHSNMLIDRSIAKGAEETEAPSVDDLKLNRITIPMNVTTDTTQEQIEAEKTALKNQVKAITETIRDRQDTFRAYGDKLKATNTSGGLVRQKESTAKFLGAVKASGGEVEKIDEAIGELQRSSGLFVDQKDPLNQISNAYENFFIKESVGIGGAFPTFKLFIVEEDDVFSDRILVFDDFFSYNSVISFSFHNSRELAATTASIQLQNISGTLDGSKKEQLRDIDLDQSSKETLENEDKETIIDSVILRPGVNIQLRAGYGNNTRDLDILLSGRITEINYTADNTVCNITVQSYGVELDTLVKANNSRKQTNNEFATTHELLGNLLLSRELKHFGRIKKGRFFQIGESRDLALEYTDFNKEYFNFSLTRTYMDTITENLGLITFGALMLPAIGPVFRSLASKFGYIGSIFDGVKAAGGWTKNLIGKSKILNFVLINTPSVVTRATRSVYSGLRGSRFFPVSGTASKGTELFGPGRTIEEVANILKLPVGSRTAPQQAVIQESINFIKGLATTQPGLVRNYFGKGFWSMLSGTKATKLVENLGEAGLETIIRNQIGFSEFLALGLGASGKMGKFGIALGGVFESFIGTFMFRNLIPTATAALVPGLSFLLVDVIVDSIKNFFGGLLNKFKETKETLLAKIFVTPQDDNIFCPKAETYIRKDIGLGARVGRRFASLGNKIIGWGLTFGYDVFDVNGDSDLEEILKNPLRLVDKRMDATRGENTYVLSNQSIWKLLHELSLRHPGYVYGTRPYGEGLEYRVFFGLPTHEYWSKPYSNSVINKMNNIYNALSLSDDDDKKEALRKILNLKVFNKDDAISSNLLLLKAYNYWLNKTKSRYTSFRKYHNFTSERDIIANNIVVSGHNVINAVSVHYKYRHSDSEEWNNNMEVADRLEGDNIFTHKMVGSSSINESNLREKEVRFENIKGIGNAVRYATGELIYGAKNMYEGSLLVLGNTKVNPWDIIILNDNITNMHGPLEVKSVTHTFSYETGFISDIEINAVVTASEKENYPALMSALAFEARKQIYDKYSNRSQLIAWKYKEEREAVTAVVKDILEKAIKEGSSSGLSFLADTNLFRSLDSFLGGSDPEVREKIKDYLQGKTAQEVLEQLDRKGEINFIEEITGGASGVPSELNDGLASQLKTVSKGSLLLSAGSVVAAGYLRSRGVSAGWIPAGLGILGGASAAGAQFTPLLTGNISSSISSGYLGKNYFRKQVFSRMSMGGVIQIYPLVRDGLPLLAGGYEEVSPSERWNNVVGNIFNDLSDATEGYYRRMKEFNSLGKEAAYLIGTGDYGFVADSVLNIGKAADLLGLASTESIVGYFLSTDDGE